MPKRKLQDEDEVFVDGAPPPSSTNNGKQRRHTSDVIDNGLDYEYVTPGPSVPVQKRSLQSNLANLDSDRKDALDRKASEIPDKVLRRADHVDATPPSIAFPEYQDYERTPSGIEVMMPVHKDAELYNMSHRNRGTCLVLNHEVFEEGTRNREGSNVDVDRIEATFGRLGFEVVVHNNLEYCDVMNNIKKLSKEKNHTNNDCVCVFVLTHGQDNNYLSAKDAAYTSDKIWKPFTADNCPSLAGKPKLFFFQACRGRKLDGGVHVIRRSDDHCRDQTDSIINSYTIPTLSDFLIAHSCADGFYSWRNPEEGTWYVQTLCNVLDKFAESTDLLKMLTMTARRVATDFQSYDDQNRLMNAQKQIPSVTSTLTRELYLIPK